MSRRPTLPISLYLTDRRAVVVGDGAGADERADRLAAAGARVERVARADYRPDLCRGAFMVVANGDDDDHNSRVARDARDAGCLAYAHDQPDLSDFAMPALIRRGPLALAISTDAVAPALSRRLREQLEALLDTAGDRLVDLVDRMETLRAELPRGGARAEALYRLASRLSISGAVEIADEDPA